MPQQSHDEEATTVVGVDVSLDDFSFFLGVVVGSAVGLVTGLLVAGLVVLLWL